MGRGKLNLKLISPYKSRSAAFRKRTKSLMKKAYELSTLCDVRTCVLIHGPAPPHPQQDHDEAEFHTWPPDRGEIEGMIRAYKTNYLQNRSMKSFDLCDFWKKKIETEGSKIRKNNNNNSGGIKYPRWDERLDCLSEYQLRMLMDDLGSKIEVAEGLIGFMEANFNAGSFDNLTENCSIIDSPLWPFNYEEEALSIMPYHDFSNLFFGSNEVEHPFSNEMMMMENNNAAMGGFQSAAPLESISPCASDYSQMMNNASSSSELVHDHLLDYSDFNFTSDWS